MPKIEIRFNTSLDIDEFTLIEMVIEADKFLEVEYQTSYKITAIVVKTDGTIFDLTGKWEHSQYWDFKMEDDYDDHIISECLKSKQEYLQENRNDKLEILGIS